MLQDNKNISSNMISNKQDFFFQILFIDLFILKENLTTASLYKLFSLSKCFSATLFYAYALRQS